MAERGGAGDGDGRLGERSSVEAEEALPGDLPSEGAGVGESEFGEMEGTEEGGFLGRIGVGAGREAMVEFCSHRGEGGAELLLGEAAGLRFRSEPELLSKARRKPGQERCLMRGRCGLLRGWQW